MPALPNLTLEIRLPKRFTAATAHSPGGTLHAAMTVEGALHRIELRDVPIYAIVLLSN